MASIKLLGLGAGDINQLSLGVYRLLLKEKNIYMRTKDHPVVASLEEEGVEFTFFDDVYERHDDFDSVYEEITTFLLEKAIEEDIVYAVPGHPLVAEKTVQLLLERSEAKAVQLQFIGGQSFLDSIFQAVKVDPIEGFQLLDATSLRKEELQLRGHIIIGQVYDKFTASEVKLTLMERLPYDYPVVVVTAAGSEQEIIKHINLVDLDREVELNNLTSIYVPPVKDEKLLSKEFSQLQQIIRTLRGPNGCPWDKKQTHLSLRKYLIEECYELIEAINEDDTDHIIEELGDVLLQVMLHSQIGEDEGYFSIEDVISSLSSKMIRRHPHVFGSETAETEADVLSNWQKIKAGEKENAPSSHLDGINTAAPKLLQAYDLQKKAAKVGFDWPMVDAVWAKVQEEWQEFRSEAGEKNNKEKQLAEFGDVLFSLVNVARFYDIDPELALALTNQKFKQRFLYIEQEVAQLNKEMPEMPLEQLDTYWNEAKQKGL